MQGDGGALMLWLEGEDEEGLMERGRERKGKRWEPPRLFGLSLFRVVGVLGCLCVLG